MVKPTRLTADFVEQIEPDGRYSDGRGGNGLSLRVRLSRDGKTPRKTWEQRLSGGGNLHTLGLGSYPALRLTAARELAAENRRRFKLKHPRRRLIDRLLDDESDSSLGAVVEESPKVGLPTFREVADDYIKAQGHWKGRAGKQAHALLDRYARGINALPVNEVDGSHIVDVLSPIWHSKSPTAKKLAGIIRAAMRFAIGKEYRDDDPTDRALMALGRQGHVTEHSGAVPFAEVSTALEYVQTSKTYPVKKLAMKFLVLTASRTSEVRLMRRREVDFETATWTIPASRMKGGRHSHRVPLSRAAVDVLAEVWQDGDDKALVFEAPNGNPLNPDALRRLLVRGYPGATPHGFRSSFRDWAAEETNYPAEICEHALAHVEGSEAVLAYRRTDYFEKRRALMAEWAEYATGDSEQLLHPVP